jgi:hypothetical protein
MSIEAEKQEPVAWMSVDCVGDRYLYFSKPLDNDPVTPLYTEPREWVGLTDEEKEAAIGWSVEHIEAKLKEKNT